MKLRFFRSHSGRSLRFPEMFIKNKFGDRMIKQLLNSVIAKYSDLSVASRSIICRSRTLSINCYLLLIQNISPLLVIITITLTMFGRILRYVKNEVSCVANCQIFEQLTEKTWGLRLSCFCWWEQNEGTLHYFHKEKLANCWLKT